jgi:hypothetical protein
MQAWYRNITGSTNTIMTLYNENNDHNRCCNLHVFRLRCCFCLWTVCEICSRDNWGPNLGSRQKLFSGQKFRRVNKENIEKARRVNIPYPKIYIKFHKITVFLGENTVILCEFLDIHAKFLAHLLQNSAHCGLGWGGGGGLQALKNTCGAWCEKFRVVRRVEVHLWFAKCKSMLSVWTVLSNGIM